MIEEPLEAAPMAAGKMGMWIFILADAFGFAALLIAYGVLHARAHEPSATASSLSISLGAALTLVLCASSGTMAMAAEAARAGSRHVARAWLVATSGLGIAFLAGQALEFHRLAAHGVTLRGDPMGAIFFVITSYHAAHVAAGVIALAVVGARATRARAELIEVVGLYWQFVDLVWILVFTLLYLL